MGTKVQSRLTGDWLYSFEIRGNYKESRWGDDPREAHEFADKREARTTLQEIRHTEHGTYDYDFNFKRTVVPKPKPIILPDEIWVMGYHTFNHLGSICHVSHGDEFYATEVECQHAIDTMKSWIGMGDRKQYRPVKFVSKKAI